MRLVLLETIKYAVYRAVQSALKVQLLTGPKHEGEEIEIMWSTLPILTKMLVGPSFDKMH